MAAALKILVVDDEADLRELLTRSFSREGHEVVAVTDGREALAQATGDGFDIVLLDVALGPGPSGYDVARALRAQRKAETAARRAERAARKLAEAERRLRLAEV